MKTIGKKIKSNLSPDWEVVKLGEVARIKTGSSNVQDAKEKGEFLFFDRSGEVKRSEKYLFDKEAVIIPGEGKEFFPKYCFGKFDLHQRAYAIFDFSEKVSGKYLFYAMHRLNRILLTSAVGSTVKSLRLPMFEELTVTLPPLPEQQKIVYVLDTIQEAIGVQEKIIEKTKELKGAMMNLLFHYGTAILKVKEFASLRVGELTSEEFEKLTGQKLKKTEIGEIPESWEVVEIGQLFDYEQPGNYIVKEKISEEKTENSIPVLTANKAFILGYTKEEKGVYKDLPVIIFDDFTTDKKFVDFPFKVKSSAMKILKLKDKQMNLRIIFEILLRIKFSHSGEHKRYYLSEYQKIKIPLPPLLEQREIADILQTIDQKIEIEEKKKALYEELFKAMLDKLMTGEIRVNNINFEQ